MKKSGVYEIILEQRVAGDFETAFLFYEAISPALSNNFTNLFELAVDKIKKKPYNYFNLTKKLRRITLGKFPYLIIYKISGEKVTVIGLFHQSSKSSSWRNPKN